MFHPLFQASEQFSADGALVPEQTIHQSKVRIHHIKKMCIDVDVF